MCGIIAAINCGHYSRDSEDFLSNAILVGAVRGQDSTGLVQTDRKNKIYTHKLAISGSAFLNNNTTQAFIKDASRSPITIIHHRAATVGSINADNAHPFICDMSSANSVTKKEHVLVGVHNGSLVNWKTKPEAAEFEVDSNWALAHIARHGVEAFEDIEGPYCFMWVDNKTPNRLMVARNHGRPMHAVFSKDRKEVFFASEAGMLAWLCERNRIATEDNIMVLGTDTLYTFDTNGPTVAITTTDIPKKAAVAQSYTTHTAVVPVVNRQPSMLNDDGKTFIDKIKAAAKYDPKAPVLNTEVIDATIKDITDDSGEEPWTVSSDGEFVADRVPTDWFSDRNATHAEKNKAKELDLFRELQWFQGVAYDDQTGEVLGDIEVWDKVNGKVKYAGVIRGCSQARANAEYIQTNLSKAISGNWVVVVGAREEKQLGKVLVVAELNQAGRAGLERMYSSH